MLKFDTYEELFTYKYVSLYFIDCIFIDRNIKFSGNREERISLFVDYDFYIQILQNLTQILNITNKFCIYIKPTNGFCGIEIEKSGNFHIR